MVSWYIHVTFVYFNYFSIFFNPPSGHKTNPTTATEPLLTQPQAVVGSWRSKSWWAFGSTRTRGATWWRNPSASWPPTLEDRIGSLWPISWLQFFHQFDVFCCSLMFFGWFMSVYVEQSMVQTRRVQTARRSEPGTSFSPGAISWRGDLTVCGFSQPWPQIQLVQLEIKDVTIFSEFFNMTVDRFEQTKIKWHLKFKWFFMEPADVFVDQTCSAFEQLELRAEQGFHFMEYPKDVDFWQKTNSGVECYQSIIEYNISNIFQP